MRDVMLAAAFVAIVLAAAGCSVILPSHANLIDEHCGNAAAISAAAQQDGNLPAYARRWFAAEAQTWAYMSDWAHGRRPKPTSQPAK